MIKAVGDKILAEFRKPESSVLIIPDQYKAKVEDEDAIVLSVGDEVTGIKAGDKIIFNPNAAMIVNILGKDYILVTKKAILAIVSGE